VVDNASTDDTASMLAREFPGVRVIRNHENLGFAGGNNVALRQVVTPYAVLLNNDSIPQPGWLRALLAPFDAPDGDELGATGSKLLFDAEWEAVHLRTPQFHPSSDDPRPLGVRLVSAVVNDVDVLPDALGALHALEPGFRWTHPLGAIYLPRRGDGPWVIQLSFATGPGRAPRWLTVNWRGNKQRVRVSDPEPTTVFIELDPESPATRIINNTGGVLLENGAGTDRDWARPDDGSYDKPADLFFGCGNGLAIRKAAGDEVGWFDDAFFLYYEDVDLSWRLRSVGWRVRFTPEAVALHENNATSGGDPELTAFYTQRNRLLTLVINASVRLAAREVALFLRESILVVSDVRRSAAERRMRRRILLSLARLLPHALRRRRAAGRAATVSRSELERLMITRHRWELCGH
jgi:GT2 family glycosyltransferase